MDVDFTVAGRLSLAHWRAISAAPEWTVVGWGLGIGGPSVGPDAVIGRGGIVGSGGVVTGATGSSGHRFVSISLAPPIVVR